MIHSSLISPPDALPDDQRRKRICELLSEAMILDAAGRNGSAAAVAVEAVPKVCATDNPRADCDLDQSPKKT